MMLRRGPGVKELHWSAIACSLAWRCCCRLCHLRLHASLYDARHLKLAHCCCAVYIAANVSGGHLNPCAYCRPLTVIPAGSQKLEQRVMRSYLPVDVPCAGDKGFLLGRCVTFATMLTGHIAIVKGICYVIAQIVGSTLGSMLTVRFELPDCS